MDGASRALRDIASYRSLRLAPRAHRWPKNCSAIFQGTSATAIAASPSQQPASQQDSVFVAADWSGRPGSAADPQPVASVHLLDNPEADDMLDEEPDLHAQADPPPDHPEDMEGGPVASPPDDTAADHSLAQIAAPSPPDTLPPAQNWWQRIGQRIDPESLQVGGASIHHSHRLCTFGNHLHRLVFCLQCGGTTSGGTSDLLAGVCRRHLGATRARQIRSMMLRHRWPAAHQQGWGRADLSGAIRFRPEGNQLLILSATGCVGFVEPTPPAALPASSPYTPSGRRDPAQGMRNDR